jgi:hypothetical protein
LNTDAPVLEEGTAGRGWESFDHWLIDASNTASMALIRPDGEPIELPLTSDRAAALSCTSLPGVAAGGLPVYTGELPTLLVPVAPDGELAGWDVIVEDITESTPMRKRLALSDAVADIKQGCALVPLAQAALLGEPLLGIYRVKLRSRGTLGSDQQFQFAFVRALSYEFSKPLYLADERPRLTLRVNGACRVAAEDVGEILPQGEAIEAISPPLSRLLTLRLQERAGREVCVSLAIPRLRWTLDGLQNHVSPGWLAEPLSVQREDFEASGEAALIVQLPPNSNGPCAMELEGTTQEMRETIRRGSVRIPLSPFRDSLAGLSTATARFVFSFTDAAGGEQRICPLLIRTRWVVEKFECRETRTVSFSWPEREAVPQGSPSECRDITFLLEDRSPYRSRRIRLWNLYEPWHPPREIRLPDGPARVEITEPTTALPAGRYRIELFTEGEFTTTAPLLPPRHNGMDVFDLVLREDDLIKKLLAPPTSLRQLLTRRLAKYGEAFDTSRIALTSADLDDLTRALILCVSEGKEKEAKHLWTQDLAGRHREAEVRQALRERIESLAERGDDGL